MARPSTTALARSVLPAAALAVGLLAVCPSPFATAQEEVDAAHVAAWVQAHYDRTQTIRARFVQRYLNRAYQSTDVSRGRVQFRKPGMMRFDYDQPNGKVITSDGEDLVVYTPPAEDEQRGQYIRQPVAQAQLPAAFGFLTGTGRLGRDYRLRRLDAARNGFPTGEVLELRPMRPTAQYAYIVLYIDSSASRRGIVHRATIVDHENNRNRFDFQQQQFNETLADSVFRFRPPRNARRIQP